MAYRVQDKTISTIMELLSEQGFEGMRESFEVLLNEVTKLERAAHLGAAPSPSKPSSLSSSNIGSNALS